MQLRREGGKRRISGPTGASGVIAERRRAAARARPTLLESRCAWQHDKRIPKTRLRSHRRRLPFRHLRRLALFGEGLPNKLVAERLGCSVRTVEQHATNLFAKLEVESRLEAVAKCLGRRK